MLYKVKTGNCYDSVIEQNLNTGLPPQISFITDKQLKGKPKRVKVEEQDIPFEEKELNLKFQQTWAE